MTKTFTYLAVLFSSVLLFSCSDEEKYFSIERETVEMPVSIAVAPTGQTQLETKATDEELAGTCNVDKILLLVYSSSASTDDRRQLTFLSRQTLDCIQENGKWVARGSVTGTLNTYYSIFALGYNSGDEFNILPAVLQTGITTYGDTKISLKENIVSGTLNSYRTPEFFAGNVMPKGAASEIFQADGETPLTGTLYRAVGKCKFTITHIPATIQKITWLTEKIADYNILYRISSTGAVFSKYPMGIPTDDELHKYVSAVTEITRPGNAEWTADMQTFLIPLTKSLFYIDATDNNDNTTRYLVKCADNYTNSIWIYILGYGVQSYRFSIPPNYQVSVKGSFEQLKNASNILIDLSDMENFNFDGGFLK